MQNTGNPRLTGVDLGALTLEELDQLEEDLWLSGADITHSIGAYDPGRPAMLDEVTEALETVRAFRAEVARYLTGDLAFEA